ncbi:Bacterial outer membrane protein, OmpA [gamma proteobacterium HdN1]|nr:Bacterial outer membrane protein, OmpA [gamma proteobacterium HdN1]
MSIFNRGHLFGLIAAVAIAGCSSSAEDTTAVDEGAGTAVVAPVTSTTDTGASTSSILSQRVVYFDFDKSAVRADAYEILQAHAQYLSSHAGARIRIEGHADERGTREYNMALGERRAKAVQSFLNANGAGAGQLEVVSYGEENPIALGHDEASWAQNRRSELVYTSEAP